MCIKDSNSNIVFFFFFGFCVFLENSKSNSDINLFRWYLFIKGIYMVIWLFLLVSFYNVFNVICNWVGLLMGIVMLLCRFFLWIDVI